MMMNERIEKITSKGVLLLEFEFEDRYGKEYCPKMWANIRSKSDYKKGTVEMWHLISDKINPTAEYIEEVYIGTYHSVDELTDGVLHYLMENDEELFNRLNIEYIPTLFTEPIEENPNSQNI